MRHQILTMQAVVPECTTAFENVNILGFPLAFLQQLAHEKTNKQLMRTLHFVKVRKSFKTTLGESDIVL